MNNQLDFFAEYESQKRRAERIFESLDTKLNSNHSQLDEALFGLIGGKKKKQDSSNWDSLSPEEQEKTFESHFEIALQNIEDKDLKIDFGGGKIVYVDELTEEEKEDALEMFKKQASKFKYKPSFVESKGFLVYDSKSATDDQKSQTDQPQPQAQNNLPTYQITYDKKSGKYFFGSPERYVTDITNSLTDLQTYNWQKSPLKNLFENPLKFGLREIVFDFKKDSILAAKDGFWIGDFNGGLFEGAFIGNSFRGRFYDNNENWKSSPTSFVSGTFIDSSKSGILGLDNLSPNGVSSTFHLIQLPVGYSVEILTDKQLRHTITCEKRLDNSNSDFIYSVYMGYSVDQTSPNRITLPWELIRQNYNAYNISKKTKSLPELFFLNSGEKIIEFKIVESGTPPLFKLKEKFDEKKKYSEDVLNLRGLKQISANIPAKNLKFNITNQTELENLNKIKGYINSKQFSNDLKNVSVYLDNKLISSSDIKTKFPYLVNVFTSDVISEAAVNLTNPRKSYGRNAYTSTSSFKNPLTGKNFQEPYEISDYLNQKYKAEIEANEGRKPAKYQKEYSDIYNALFGTKKASASVNNTTNDSNEFGGISKEEDVVLKRIESFIKYFVYKIDNGKSTNKIRKYFIDLLKSKITIHKQPQQLAQTQAKTTSASKVSAVKPKPQPKGAIGKTLKENLLREEIRKILKTLV